MIAPTPDGLPQAQPHQRENLAHFQQKRRCGFVPENAQIQTLDRIPGGKALHTFPECGLAHFQQKCRCGFVPENAQIQTLDRIPGGKPLHTFPECGLRIFNKSAVAVLCPKMRRFKH